jgi:hypothetical protein
MSEIFLSFFDRLAAQQVESFYKNEPVYIECLVKFKSLRKIMLGIYNSQVSLNKILPIEKLNEGDKMELWEQTKTYSNNRLNKNEIIELAKTVWCLSNLLDEKKM